MPWSFMPRRFRRPLGRSTMNTDDNSHKPSRRQASIFEVLMFVWSYWRKTPVRFAGMLIGTALGVVLEVHVPQTSADLVVVTREALEGRAPSADAWWAAAVLIALFAAIFMIKQLYIRNWMHVATTVMQQLLVDGFGRVQRFSLDWHNNHFAGSTQRKITRGMWAYDTLADAIVVELGPTLGLLVGFTAAMAWRDPILGVYFGVAVFVFLVVSIALSVRYVAPANVLSNQSDTAVSGSLADAIANNAVVKAFGAEAREDHRFAETSQLWRYRSRRAWLRSADSSMAQYVLLLTLLGGLLALVLAGPGGDTARVESAVYVITAYLVVNGSLRSVGGQVRRAQRAVNELDDLVSFVRMQPAVKDRPRAPAFRRGKGAVQFDHVWFGYRNQARPIFQDLSVEIEPGEKLALVGESGSGKSTFAKLIQRLYDVDDGHVVIDGQDVREVAQSSLRQAISVVPQDPILFHRSLAENIAYGCPGASFEDLVRAAKQAHADDFIQRLEHGYETLVGERGVKLSGGERQRVAIARAILADSPILVLDEATSSLDSVTEHLIQEALDHLMKGRTAVVIAHRLSTIRQADRILVFDAGRVVEEGSHEQLLARQGGRYRSMVEMQAFDTGNGTWAPRKTA